MHEDGGIREFQYLKDSFQRCYISLHIVGFDNTCCRRRLKDILISAEEQCRGRGSGLDLRAYCT